MCTSGFSKKVIMRGALRCMLIAVSLILIAGCSESEGESIDTSATLSQVNNTIDKYVEHITHALSFEVDKNDELALNQRDVPCDQESAGSELSRFAQRSYPISNVDPNNPKPIFAKFSERTDGNGFDADRTNENNSTHPVSRATNKSGYKLGIDVLNGSIN